ncbi:MAG: Triosephosphate isomerase [Ktedonobacterales bacterium]|jgi:triosephosphate isomerase|nr:MAG: Triosephosphate isomerase [Ktedonobacterales bacterium]
MSGSTVRRVPIIAGNWKMNLGPTEARDFAASILADLGSLPSVERVLCPPAISIPAVHAVTSGSDLRLGAQNMYFEEKGAYTGEISPLMLQGLCEYVILGHSERRGYFGETDELVNRKALSAFAHRLRPIVCVGERLEDRDANLTERVITTQVQGSLAGLPAERLGELVVAYEPIWAIGTGRAATAQDAADVVAIIRALLVEMYGAVAAGQVRVQYGGSVTAANIAEFAANPDIDGALVGGASLKPEFVEIVRKTAAVKGA